MCPPLIFTRVGAVLFLLIGVLLFVWHAAKSAEADLAASYNAAATSGFECVIQKAIPGHAFLFFRKYNESRIGRVFMVDRHSGIMTGSLNNSAFRKRQIVDYGGHEHSYKVIATTPRIPELGSGASLLVISEFVKSPKKPFRYMNNYAVFFGYCRYILL